MVSDWEKICWSDECSIEVRGTGVRRTMVRRLENERFHPYFAGQRAFSIMM